MTKNTPRVWVACLACYNDGTLTGEWVDATDADTLRDSINHVLHHGGRQGHAGGDWAIHDYDNFYGLASTLGENPDLDELAKVAQAIEEHGKAFAVYAEDVGVSFALENFEEAYQGEYRSEADFAMQLAEDIGALDDNTTWPHSCIDWDQAARELFMGDYSYQSGYVFRTL